jgi:hypothetical protein
VGPVLQSASNRFTLHGLRYTFTDLVRLANVDAVVRRALTGHVTEEMQRHYSTVGMEEKRAAVAGVLKVLEGGLSPKGGPTVGPSRKLMVARFWSFKSGAAVGCEFEHFRGAGYRIRTGDLQLGNKLLVQ